MRALGRWSVIDWVNKAIMGLLLSALISCGGYILYLRGEISDLNDTVSGQADTIDNNELIIDRYVENAKANDQLIADFRASLDDLKKRQELKEAEIAKALADAEIVSKKYESYSASLLATIPKSSNMCKEAEDMINSYLAKEKGVK